MEKENMENKDKVIALVNDNAFAKHIGIELLELEEGYCKGRIKMDEHNRNVYGSMHGGCSYALADTIAGIAASTYGNYVTTINGSMNYLLPVADTEYVYCESRVIRQGRTVGVYDAVIQNDEGDVLCTSTFNYFRLDKKID